MSRNPDSDFARQKQRDIFFPEWGYGHDGRLPSPTVRERSHRRHFRLSMRRGHLGMDQAPLPETEILEWSLYREALRDWKIAAFMFDTLSAQAAQVELLVESFGED